MGATNSLTSTKYTPLAKEEIALQTTIMAIRETLMDYFKGTCIERLTSGSNVRLEYADRSVQYTYQRRLNENQREAKLYISNALVFSLYRAPETIVFHTPVLSRSPQLRRVKVEIERFLKQYLPVVDKEDNDGTNANN